MFCGVGRDGKEDAQSLQTIHFMMALISIELME